MLIILVLLLIVFGYIWKYYENVRRYPKGPTPLPIIGNLLTYDWRHAHLQLSELTKIYGDVFTIWLPRPFIVVSDFNLLKEAFRGDDFSDRSDRFPDTAFMNIENGGIIFSSGESWRNQRRVAVTILRDFGMGKNLMESHIQNAVREALIYMDSLDHDRLDVRWPIQLLVSNVITKAVYNIQFKSDALDSMQKVSDSLQEFLDNVKESKLFFFAQTWPWIEKIPFYEQFAFGPCRKAVKPIKEMVEMLAEESLKGYDVSQEPECLAQAYFQKMETSPELSYPHLLNVCMDFFIAGMETSSTILRWSCLYLAKHQEIQDKMRKEIADNIGFDRVIHMNDKAKLPFCNAVIQEVERMANIVPMNVIHKAIRDSQIGGHFIPRETFVLGQISHVLAHSERFPEPEKFKPERFLMNDGVTANKEALEHLIPFGIGKRQCAGEALARMEIFIGLLSIVQRYKIQPLPGKEIDLEPIYGQILLPKQQFLRVAPVNANKY